MVSWLVWLKSMLTLDVVLPDTLYKAGLFGFCCWGRCFVRIHSLVLFRAAYAIRKRLKPRLEGRYG
jgi:hypothetical protein